MIILHAADLHFGKGHRPEAAEALLRLADELEADAVVVAGDLTHRAKKREFLAAKEFLARLAPRTVVVTPGNHDVPLYRFWERLFAPYAKYRRFIGDTDTFRSMHKGTRLPVRFASMSSAAPWNAIVNGRVTRGQLDWAALGFMFAPRGELGTFRVLVLHHPLVDPDDGERVQPFPEARKIICRAVGWAVDLILGGHIHRSHIGVGICDPLSYDGDEAIDDPFRFAPLKGEPMSQMGSRKGEVGVPVLIAGTASSTRGRGPEQGRNSVNVITVGETEMEAAVYLYSDESGDFKRRESRVFPRRPPPRPMGPREPAKLLSTALVKG